jgi:phosphoadenosine phosphosulfate reductase
LQQEEILSFDAKIAIARIVIKDALSQFKRPAIIFNTDKRSTVILHLLRDLRRELNSDMLPVLFVDHGRHFEDSFKMLRELSDLWKFNALIAKNEDAILKMDQNGFIKLDSLNQINQDSAQRAGFSDELFKNTSNAPIADFLLIDLPKKALIEKYRFDSIFVSETDFEEPVFIRTSPESRAAVIDPILIFSEKDIWNYTFKFELPINPLYRQCYSVIDDKFGHESKLSHPPWEGYIETRAVKTLSEEDELEISERLKRLGYM